MIKAVHTYLIDPLLELIFPQFCAVCQASLSSKESTLCFSCVLNLPLSVHFQNEDSLADQLFYGKAKLQKVAPLLQFVEGGAAQIIIHQLKYRNRTDIGIYLGKHMAKHFSSYDWFTNVDLIIPVPLHRKKENHRGYNQSLYIAEGLADHSGKAVMANNLVRTVNTESQTQKTKDERVQNVQGVFKIKQPQKLENKHVLLVDDVLTTGATLASCANTLSTIPGIKISVATAAIALD